MASRFYLPSAGSAAVAPSFGPGWEATTGADRIRCVTAKSSTAMTTKTFVAAGNTDCLLRQYVSDAINAATITGTVKGQIRAAEEVGTQDARAQMLIKVVSNDGGTVRGTLLGHDTGGLANEFATSLTNRKWPKGSSGASLTSVDASAGDRIVIELGYRSHNTEETGDDVQLRFGDTGGTDLAEDETTTADNVPWIEFSQTFTFQGQQAAIIEGGGDITLSGLAGPDHDYQVAVRF